LHRLAREHNLELVISQNFHEFYIKNKNEKNIQLMKKMKVLDKQNTIPKNNWEVIGICRNIIIITFFFFNINIILGFYIIFVFKKLGHLSKNNAMHIGRKKTYISYKDIITVV